MIQSQIVLHRFEVVMPCEMGSPQVRPNRPGGNAIRSLRVPARVSDVTIISRAVHNCPEVLQEDRLVCYFQYY
jgi:hypothetical protein